MLRLPTIINFPLLFLNNKRIRQEQAEQQAEEECTRLLIPEETLVKKHHGSIIKRQQEPFFAEEIIQEQPVYDNSRYSSHEVRQELHAILKFAIPLIVTFILGVGNRVVDVWFLGQVGSEGKYHAAA